MSVGFDHLSLEELKKRLPYLYISSRHIEVKSVCLLNIPSKNRHSNKIKENTVVSRIVNVC